MLSLEGSLPDLGAVQHDGYERATPRSAGTSPTTRRLLRGATALVRRSSNRRAGDREAVLLALAATDAELLAVAEKRRFFKKVVAVLTAPFLVAEILFAVVAWQGLMMVQEDDYEPNYMQWKIIVGFFYYGSWTFVIKNCADACLADCAALFPWVRAVTERSIVSSIVTSFLGYVPGMWCCSLFLAYDSLPHERKNSEFCRKVFFAGYLQLAVLVIAWVVLVVRARDRAAVSSIRRRLHDTLAITRGLLNGCEDVVRRMQKVPYDSEDLMDPDDGEPRECPICAEVFSEDKPIVITTCMHLFHEDCLAKWCNSQHACPLCRTDLRAGGDPDQSV